MGMLKVGDTNGELEGILLWSSPSLFLLLDNLVNEMIVTANLFTLIY